MVLTQRKLAIPFERSRNAGIHNKIEKTFRNIERNKITAAKISTALKMSPEIMNIPFTKSNNAGRRRN